MNAIWAKNSLGFDHPDIFGISFDSRSIKKGDAFFALKANNDGHDFVQDALNNGAACAFVERNVALNNIVVPSVFDLLKKMALLRRSQLAATVICVTGSVGKTTSKDAIYFFLNDELGKKVYAAKNSYNNLLGVFVTLASAPLDIDYLVVEIGTGDFGEIDLLASFVLPDYSLITHIAPAHIGVFKTLKNILNEKMGLIKYTKKALFFNADLWYSNKMAEVASSFSLPYFCFNNDPVPSNSLKNAWILLFKQLGFSINIDAFSLLRKGRKLFIDSYFNELNLKIMDSSYNANLASMVESISFFNNYVDSNFKGFNKVAILFPMTGIGLHAKRYHQVLNCFLKDFSLFLFGSDMKFLADERKDALWFDNVDDFKKALLSLLPNNSAVFIKGSRNVVSDQIFDFLTSN